MLKIKNNKRGMVLLMVLGVVIVVGVLSSALLQIMLSQYSLTSHQTARIQAYYAGLAAMNYALEQLRTGVWTYTPTNSCPNTAPCSVTDSTFPSSIIAVRVIFCNSGQLCTGSLAPCAPPPGITFCVNANAVY